LVTTLQFLYLGVWLRRSCRLADQCEYPSTSYTARTNTPWVTFFVAGNMDLSSFSEISSICTSVVSSPACLTLEVSFGNKILFTGKTAKRLDVLINITAGKQRSITMHAQCKIQSNTDRFRSVCRTCERRYRWQPDHTVLPFEAHSAYTIRHPQVSIII